MLPEIADALERAGITTPFPIQEMTLPVALMGTDLIGQARTGTGKTLAFGIPLLQRTVAPHDPDYEELAAPGKPQALVVAPTRELALQVAGDLTLAGARPRHPRADRLRRRRATSRSSTRSRPASTSSSARPAGCSTWPNRRALDLSHVKVLVLDEADEMLDLGFLPDVERLSRKTPETRQTMLFSATMPGAIVVAGPHPHAAPGEHPRRVRATTQQTVPATAQFIYQVHDLDKPEMVARILQAENPGLTIVFTRTKRAAQRVADDLAERGFDAQPAARRHGSRSPARRR